MPGAASRRRPATLAAVLAVIGSLPTSAPAVDPADVIGRWRIRIDAGGEVYNAELLVEPEGDRLGGRFEMNGRRDRVTDVRVEQGAIVVEAPTRRFSMPLTAYFTGLVEGDLFEGDVDFDAGGDVRSYPFAADRVAAAPGATTDRSTDQSEPREGQTAPPGPRKASFRQGEDGYRGAVDLELWAIAPSKPLAEQGTMTSDANNGGGESQVLMRFDEIFGDAPGLVPPGSRVVRATLSVVAFDPGTTVFVHRMLAPWSESSTWDALAAGVSVDGLEATMVRDGFTFGQITMDKQDVAFDVTQTVQAWADGEPNHGWVAVNTGDNGWDFYSSDWIEADLRPRLEVEYEPR